MEELVRATDNGKPIPVMVESLHGVGKSEIIKQLADKWGKGFYDCRTSELSEGDILGFPRAGGEYMDYLPPKFVLDASRAPYVLLFDEFNRGTPEVFNALMRAGDSHMIGNVKLHEGTRIFAATNPEGQGNHVRRLDRPQKDRWWKCVLEPSSQEWLLWAEESGVNAMVVDYIRENPDDLDPPPYEKSSGYRGSSVSLLGGDDIEPSRRSWVRLSRVLDVRDEGDLRGIFPLAAGFVGHEKALSFESFCLHEGGRSPWKRFIVEGAIQSQEPTLEESIGITRSLERGAMGVNAGEDIKDHLALFIAGAKPENLSRVFAALRDPSFSLDNSIEILKRKIPQREQTVGEYIMNALKL